jgi:hypothetical protein
MYFDLLSQTASKQEYIRFLHESLCPAPDIILIPFFCSLKILELLVELVPKRIPYLMEE